MIHFILIVIQFVILMMLIMMITPFYRDTGRDTRVEAFSHFSVDLENNASTVFLCLAMSHRVEVEGEKGVGTGGSGCRIKSGMG